jgi:hypothetical protein
MDGALLDGWREWEDGDGLAPKEGHVWSELVPKDTGRSKERQARIDEVLIRAVGAGQASLGRGEGWKRRETGGRGLLSFEDAAIGSKRESRLSSGANHPRRDAQNTGLWVPRRARESGGGEGEGERGRARTENRAGKAMHRRSRPESENGLEDIQPLSSSSFSSSLATSSSTSLPLLSMVHVHSQIAYFYSLI